MEGSLEKFNLCCLFSNIKVKIKNRYVKEVWRFLSSNETMLTFKNKSIVEKDFLVAIAQKPDCLDSDLFPPHVRVFGKKILDILKRNQIDFKLECYVQSTSFEHTVVYKKVPVSNTQEKEISEDVDMSCPNTNKESLHDELNEYKAEFLSHITRVTNKVDRIQENHDSVTETNPNNDNLEHNTDDVAMTSNDDVWQEYMSDSAEESITNNDISQDNNDDEVIVVSSDDMWQDYMSDNGEEYKDNDVVVVSKDSSELLSNIDGNPAQVSSENVDSGITESKKSLKLIESQEFYYLVIRNIPCDDLTKLMYSIRDFFRHTKLQETFPRLNQSEQAFLQKVAEKPHLLVASVGLPIEAKEAGKEVIRMLRKNRNTYRWECASFHDTVIYKKTPVPGLKTAKASTFPTLPKNKGMDPKIVKLPRSGDCVVMDPDRVLDSWLAIEGPIFSALLQQINDESKVLSFLTTLKEFLNSNQTEITLKPGIDRVTELFFKISARPSYLDTELFSDPCRSLGVELLALLRAKAEVFYVACLVKGRHIHTTITFKKMRSRTKVSRELRKEKKMKMQLNKKVQRKKDQLMDVGTSQVQLVKIEKLDHYNKIETATNSRSEPARAIKEKFVEALNTPFVSPLTQRMMANMGWKGGALGKNGEGIATPIMPNLNQTKHAGLGYVNTKKGKKVQKPALKDHQYFIMLRLLGVLYAFLNDDSEETTYVDVADLECEDFPRSAANILAFVNRREVMYNVSPEEEGMFEEIVNQMMCDQNLVLRHSVVTSTRINIIKVSLSQYKEEMRSQSTLSEEAESTNPKVYQDALYKSLEAPIENSDTVEAINSKEEINNNIFVSPEELLKQDEDISNYTRVWYPEERNWSNEPDLTSNDLVERLARDLFKCRQRLTDSAYDKNRILGLAVESNDVLNEEMASFIQKNLLKELDKLNDKTSMKLKCFGIRNNMLIYQSLNDDTYDWLIEAVKEIDVKIFDFTLEENNCRGLLVASIYGIENDDELLERIKEFNEDIDISAWEVINRFKVGNQVTYEVIIDRKSLLYIFNNNCTLNLGIDQAEFVFVGPL